MKSVTLWNAVTILGVTGQRPAAMRLGAAFRWSRKSSWCCQAVMGFRWNVLETKYRRRPGTPQYVRKKEGGCSDSILLYAVIQWVACATYVCHALWTSVIIQDCGLKRVCFLSVFIHLHRLPAVLGFRHYSGKLSIVQKSIGKGTDLRSESRVFIHNYCFFLSFFW